MIVTLQTLMFFRESLLTALDRLLRPYYKLLVLDFFTRSRNALEDEESDDQVFAEYDDEKGVTFYPPVYAQRYAAVSDCLMDERWCGLIEKVVDFGHHDMSFIKYLKDVPGIRYILGVDIETIPLKCSSDLLGGDDYSPKRESPLQVTLFQGNAADPDYRLIGCDAVIAIEMIEHMLPHDLERFVHTVFGFIKPRIAVFTTPNADFNILFKALEKNGLRRLDHLFEWTRDQFNDWCSNIVVRYPNYTVTCKGIGPGPPGTLHYGCCSQLSLFVSKDYTKQADLHLNSLASQLVPNEPTPNNFSKVFEGWENSVDTYNEGAESLTEILYPENQSHMTLVISSSLSNSLSMETFTYRDQTLQCNLDTEIGKSFMMFNYEDYYHVLVPRRRVNYRVYEMGDVYSRLNCTTLQVKKFSKTTQNLMAKNRIDSLVHTREVVNEICHLTKSLNFKNFSQTNGAHIWCNINWGYNAPYWNQYYKIVKEYIYPFETKSEEVRILDLVSEEINRLIDTQYDEEFSVDVNRLEIPLSHLMSVIQHITNDVDRIRDLLEWNGYEIVNDVVIHSRLVVDTTSMATQEDDWQDDTFSDWDTTDVHTPALSDHSTIVPDFPGRCLHRALDQKVRNLRKMLSVDEDISTELDGVVCRLMKLALHSSRGRQTPPPTKWMQCKLLDLLTLTEKAIGKRKKSFLENFPLNAIENKQQDVPQQDSRVEEIVDKYGHLLQPLEKTANTDVSNDPLTDMDLEDEFLSTTSAEFLKDNEYIAGMSPSLIIPQPIFSTEAFKTTGLPPDENPLERTKAWLDEDIEIVPYPKHEINYDNISSGDTDHSASNARHKHKKSTKKKSSNKNIPELDAEPYKISPSKTLCKFKTKREKKRSNTQIIKKVAKKKYSFLKKNSIGENSSTEYDNHVFELKAPNKKHQTFNVMASKPIAESLIELCHSDSKRVESHGVTDNANVVISNMPSFDISATEESFFVDIVMQDFEETVALRRTVGTDAEVTPEIIRKDNDENFSKDSDEKLCAKYEVSTENMQSQIFFLNDINEPSTSKGIRHNISTDVQCGPDTLSVYPMLSAATSLVEMPQIFSTGIKIDDESAIAKVKRTDFGTSTEENHNLTTMRPRLRSVGIKIKKSEDNLCCQTECSTMTVPDSVPQTCATVTHTPRNRSSAVNSVVSSTGTKLIKSTSSTLKIKDSGSEFCSKSITSSSKMLSYFTNASKNSNNVLTESFVSKEATTEKDSPTFVLPKLSCGGVHVHSFRNREVSEDVVYQGEWQRSKPKAFARKRTYNSTTLRKLHEMVNTKKIKENLKAKKGNSKEKIFIKKQEEKQMGLVPKKPTQMRDVKLHKVRQENNNDQIKKPHVTKSAVKILTNTKNTPRPMKTVTKVASNITTSEITSKTTKSTFTIKRPAILSNVTDKKDNDKPLKLKKSYIPLYLMHRMQSARNKDKLNKSLDSATDTVKGNIDKKAKEIAPLVRSKTEEIRKDLLNFSDDLRDNISYVIFRNDLEDKIESPDKQTSQNSKDKSAPKQLNMLKRSLSPSQSLNSSNCSSPSSIATVKAASTRTRNTTNRKHSTSSHKSNLTNSESDNPTPTKTKKVVKRYKTSKKTENKDIVDKENIPESTNNFVRKHTEKKSKSSFMDRNKSVCIAQMKTECSTPPSTLSRQKAQISNVKISSRRDSDEKRKSIDPSLSKKTSLKSNTSSSIYEDFNQSETKSYLSLDSANMVLVLEPQPNYEDCSKTCNGSQISSTECGMKNNHNQISEWLQNSSLNSQDSTILNSMRHILEETLDRINISSQGLNMSNFDSKTVILSKDENPTANVDLVTPPEMNTDIDPVQTINNFLESDIENALNRTFDSVLDNESTVGLNDTKLSGTDLDLLSFKSITEVSTFSEYYLADNEFNTSPEIDQVQTRNTTSVQDIFERKEIHLTQNIPSTLAVQAFSGFSLDASVAGDQPDPVALIDSETGSMAAEITRQATSEELLISGRSSESCILDEDAVVPNWLFHLISQQQSVEEDRQSVLGPVVEPLDEPSYDVNGNVMEPSLLGVGAGAGDGRGMHSDHSQDSSGRGTSHSSSDTSSETQSEVSTVLIDPSDHSETLRDPTTSSAVPLDHQYSLGMDDDAETLIGSRDDQTRTLNGASDTDADISSIGTDVLDASDN